MRDGGLAWSKCVGCMASMLKGPGDAFAEDCRVRACGAATRYGERAVSDE